MNEWSNRVISGAAHHSYELAREIRQTDSSPDGVGYVVEYARAGLCENDYQGELSF